MFLIHPLFPGPRDAQGSIILCVQVRPENPQKGEHVAGSQSGEREGREGRPERRGRGRKGQHQPLCLLLAHPASPALTSVGEPLKPALEVPQVAVALPGVVCHLQQLQAGQGLEGPAVQALQAVGAQRQGAQGGQPVEEAGREPGQPVEGQVQVAQARQGPQQRGVQGPEAVVTELQLRQVGQVPKGRTRQPVQEVVGEVQPLQARQVGEGPARQGAQPVVEEQEAARGSRQVRGWRSQAQAAAVYLQAAAVARAGEGAGGNGLRRTQGDPAGEPWGMDGGQRDRWSPPLPAVPFVQIPQQGLARIPMAHPQVCTSVS